MDTNNTKLSNKELLILCEELVSIIQPLILNHLELSPNLIKLVLDHDIRNFGRKSKLNHSTYSHGTYRSIKENNDVYILCNNIHKVQIYFGRIYNYYNFDKVKFIVYFIGNLVHNYYHVYQACCNLAFFDENYSERNSQTYNNFYNKKIELEANNYAVGFMKAKIGYIANHLYNKRLVYTNEAVAIQEYVKRYLHMDDNELY